MTLQRCEWVTDDPLYIAYHDTEWGVPNHDERYLFEKLLLEGFQAGLSWITILRKRQNFRAAFDNFDAETIARYDDAKRAALLADAGIVRNRLKIDAAISNAQAYLALRERGQTLEGFVWAFVDGQPIQNAYTRMDDVPAQTDLSQQMSKTLKSTGFRFVGPTICYAYMQSIGLVNDHLAGCFRHAEVQ